ncbi:MAG: UDP-N-acetylmuramate dehydrogenase [Solirubrobacteraceae bacterium]|nr:UDP-N-acetylmuramate dehydrogenase [Solirubrobacteraceae bacterium]
MSITVLDAPLAPLTTLRLGGPARRLVEARTEDELVAAVREADAAGEPLLLLAGGSNVVIADAGFDGTVVQVATRGIERRRLADGRVAVTVQAGELWDALVAGLVADGLAGVECLAGIPGSAGATPIQNVGAYGQEVAGTIRAVRALDRATGDVVELAPEDCAFGYRTSAFKGKQSHAILAVSFALRPDRLGLPLRYAELGRALDAAPGQRVPLADARTAVLELRRGKGMVLDAGDRDTCSAGSFFTNPVLEPRAFDALCRRAAALPGARGEPPRFDEPGGHVKTSAAWLIEAVGFRRGDARGSVALSSKHVLALTNRGGASAGELLAFAHEIADLVELRLGVRLRPEPVLVGASWD